jgi:uncharacterized protein YjbI with pentapeptide repeats
MTDETRIAPEGETPVNPYSLLEAVNNSSDTAHTAWLIFLAIMAYLMIAVAGVTHRDLLLETPVTLPILQVSIQQAQFFQFASVLVVLFHLGVVSQLVLLARKALEFDAAVRSLEVTERRTHPLRLELHNFFFVQAIAGPHRSVVMSAFLHGMSWLTLVILPVVLLLYIQISYLPYHDVATTWVHRGALIVDIVMLVTIGVFLMRAETSFFQAFWRATLHHPFSFVVTTGVLALVAFFSFFVATVPDEALDRATRTLTGADRRELGSERRQRLAGGFQMPFVQARADGSLWGLFHRNLIVTDADLVPEKSLTGEDASLNLRDRDLRHARLDRTDLHRADFTGADLSGASLVGADLRGIRLQCADVTELILTENREAARCAEARRANFTRALLTGARLVGVDLRGARLEEANLEGVELTHAILTGANFAGARLDKADLSGGVQMQGANFLVASLQGADLTGVRAQFADFSSAAMQGSVLALAELQGAVLRDADVEGVDLSYAKLQGADLTGLKARAADFKGAAVWLTSPPPPDGLALADLTEVSVAPLEASAAGALVAMLETIDNPRLRRQVKEAIDPVTNIAQSRAWAGSPQERQWQALIAAGAPALGEAYRTQLTDYLTHLMCRSRWSNGAVATGIAKRAQGQQFRGDMAAIYDRVRAKECPAKDAVLPKTLKDLGTAVDLARVN